MEKIDIIEKLKSKGYRLTKARTAIVDSILKFKGQPISAEGIFTKVNSQKRGSCDLVSVYRTISTLEELGVLRKCDVFGDRAFYEFVEQDQLHRHHIVCTKCQKIRPVDFCLIQAFEQVLTKMGYTEITHRLEFKGICPNCATFRKV